MNSGIMLTNADGSLTADVATLLAKASDILFYLFILMLMLIILGYLTAL
jgi:hypothetical protein